MIQATECWSLPERPNEAVFEEQLLVIWLAKLRISWKHYEDERVDSIWCI